MANLIAVFLTIGVAVIVLRPLFAAGTVSSGGPQEKDRAVRENLLERKTLLEVSLRDLEFEHEMRNLSEADYEQLRQASLAEAQAVEEQLEHLAKPKPSKQPNRKRRRK